LSQLDLPLDELGLLDFLGESAEGVVPSAVRVTAVDGDVVTLKTDLTPHELVQRRRT